MQRPPIVSAREWDDAHRQLLTAEKELTRARDGLGARVTGWPRAVAECRGWLSTSPTPSTARRAA